MIGYSLTSGDKIGWALDEDLRLIREALGDTAHEAPVPFSRLIHAPFWMGLDAHHPEVLKNRFVLAHADNPPFFYLTQPEFARAQQSVDLWVARSTEALAQFEALRLPCTHVPYAIDEDLFFPIADRSALRSRLGLDQGQYVIGNFHRDSEGADLMCPKLQKAPELVVLICKKLLAAGAPIHVLLAGPRRHWIRKALTEAAVPFTFIGESGIDGDDLRQNILTRQRLNELYSACDLYLIPSRWEGGPQSAMEGAAAKTKLLSLPLGVARDILEPESLFETVGEAVSTILADISRRILDPTVEPQYLRWKKAHSLEALRSNLRALYAKLEPRLKQDGSPLWTKNSGRDLFRDAAWQLARSMALNRHPRQVTLIHEEGSSPYLDAAIPVLREALAEQGLLNSQAKTTLAGWVSNPASLAHRVSYQITGPELTPDSAIPGAVLVTPSAQDAVNYRTDGGCQPVLVCPLPLPGQSDDPLPLVIDEHETRASREILSAQASGIPVVYHENSHYRFSVFHGGIPYGPDRPLDEAVDLAETGVDDLTTLASPPSKAHVLRFFKTALVRQPKIP